jgi:hypothetical protein
MDTMPTPRRTFLSILGLGALASTGAAPSLAAETDLRAVDEQWDLSWIRKVKAARYRAVFDAPALGNAASRASMWHSQYLSVYHVDERKLAGVLVIRHQGIAAAMDDAFWDMFDIAKSAARQDSTETPAPARKGNASRRDIELFLSKGGIVLACNLAFGMMVAKFRNKDTPSDEARKQALQHLIPGIVLQPSGPFALMRAQDEGCGYMMAS